MVHQFLDLFVTDVQTQFLFGLGQGNPEPSPGSELLVIAKELLHLPGCIAGGQGDW